MADVDAEPAVSDAHTATIEHIAQISGKMRILYDRQVDAEMQVIHRIACDFESGRIGPHELYAAFARLRAVAATGFVKRWNARFSDPYNTRRMIHMHLHLPDLDGNWRGPFPLAPDEIAPPTGQSVVYVLFDDANAPCYVGSSEQFRTRLKNHERDGKPVTRWLAYPCSDREAAYLLEEKLLREHRPYLNKRVSR